MSLSKKIFILILLGITLTGNISFASNTEQATEFRKIRIYKLRKTRPLQIKVIPQNTACKPDTNTPKNCNIKK